MKEVYAYGHRPEHLVYDNNCHFKKFVANDSFFDDMGLTVDVFHFDKKHKATDLYCQTHCNPVLYPELRKAQGGWQFNTSIAEQTNRWLTGFAAICQEMVMDKFNFFLDEMIIRRNLVTYATLDRKGLKPGYWPSEPYAPQCV